MNLLAKALLLFALILVGARAFSQNAYIRLRSFPQMMVADGRSTSTITAEVRDGNGRLVPDGTQVLFYTTLGSFRENVVSTVDGLAQAILVSSGVPGLSTVTANALTYNTTATLVYEFVADKSQLSSASDFVEIVAPGYLKYSMDDRVLEASESNQGVSFRYRNLVVDADDMQYDVASQELVAKKARMRMGKGFDRQFSVLRYDLRQRQGTGITTIEEMVEDELRQRTAVVSINGDTLAPLDGPSDATLFEFKPIWDAPQLVSGDKAVVYQGREIYFYKASVHIDGKRVLQMPLLQVNLDGRAALFTEEVLQVNYNQVSLSYPYYLSLKPGETSLLRLRSGGQYGRTTTSQSGIFLDYELNWNKGDDSRGNFTLGGLGRSDWGIGAHHWQRLDSQTTGYVQVDLPAHRSIFGSASVNRQFDGFTATLSGNMTSTLRDVHYRTQQASLVVESNPIKLGSLPFQMHIGLTASESSRETDLARGSQSSYGVRLRNKMQPQRIGPHTMLNATASVGKVAGRNSLSGLTTHATLMLTQQLGARSSVTLTYDYAEDGFSNLVIGRHRLSAQGFMHSGNASVSLFASKSLDLDRVSYWGDAGYRFHRDWRLAASYTLDQYLGNRYRDYALMLGYRIGERELGLAWSARTKRIGVQFLGATLR